MNICMRISISKKLIVLFFLPFIWFFFASAVFAFFTNSYASGLFHTIMAFAGVILLFSDRIQALLIDRSIPVYALIFYFLYMVMAGGILVSDLLTVKIISLGRVNIAEVISVVFDVGYLAILAYVLIAVAKIIFSAKTA